ncbi:glycosyltransferase family 4 protein [Mesorhizobium sediminum]|nr:glycosyltransferase family 4 protein [Mesorhizobium sediminum]
MRIVLVNRYFHPDQSATSRMVSGLAFALAKRGYSVAVVTSRQFHNDNDAVLPARETIQGVEVTRLATSAFGRGSLPGRAADYLSFHVLAAWWMLVNARRGDLCVNCTDPPLLSVATALPIRLRGAALVGWVMDLFPETAIELGMLDRHPRLAALALRLRNWSDRRASLIVCPTGTMARHLAATTTTPISVVHHWSDGGEIRPIERQKNELRAQWGLRDKFVVGYSGNFGRAHDFSTLLEAADRLRDQNDIHFLMVGDGRTAQDGRGGSEAPPARKRDLQAAAADRRAFAKPLRRGCASGVAAAGAGTLHHSQQVLRRVGCRPADAFRRFAWGRSRPRRARLRLWKCIRDRGRERPGCRDRRPAR